MQRIISDRKYDSIILPVETAARELDAKLLLALFAADVGFTCYLGMTRAVHAPGFPPSIYISRSVRFAKPLKLVTSFGHVIAAWDEEGLVRLKDEVHGQRLEPAALRLPKLLLSWGSSNTHVWRDHPSYDGCPIAETGNPRVDFLRRELRPFHELQREELRSRYGNFVLFNTNFGIVNHFTPQGKRLRVTRKSYDPERFRTARERIEEHKRKLFEKFLSMIPRLADHLRPYNLVIRPHPSEDPKPWQEVSRGKDNVFVVYEGSVIPWMLASKCLIHNGCTSAVEASVLKVPVLAYCPVTDPDYEVLLPNELSERIASESELIERARELASDNSTYSFRAATDKLLQDHIASLDGPFSCERIVAALREIPACSPSPVSIADRVHSYAKYALRCLKAPSDYYNHLRPPDEFTVDSLSRRIARIGGALSRFGNVRVTQRSPGVVVLSTH
jgi:surface carbohydrate biosynthesis protein